MTDRSSSASETPGRQSLLTSSTVTGGGLISTHNASNNSEMMNRKMVSMTTNRPHSWHNWSSRIRQAIQSTLLTPQEFFGKVSRLKHTLMMRNSTTLSEATENDEGHAANMYSGGYDTVRSHMTTSPDNTGRGRSGSTADGMISPVRRHSLSTVAMKSLTAQIGNFSNSSHNITSNAMNTAATDLEQIAKAMYRLKHTLIGFQYLLHITLIESKDVTLTVSHANEWMSSFAESFLLLLPSSNILSTDRVSVEDGVDKLLPFLIELWFHLTVGIEVLSQHDWLFWELTKVYITYISLIYSVYIHIILFNLPSVYI